MARDVRSAFLTVTVCVMQFTLAGCLGDSKQDQVDPRLGQSPVAYVQRTVPLDDDEVMLPRNELEPVAFFRAQR